MFDPQARFKCLLAPLEWKWLISCRFGGLLIMHSHPDTDLFNKNKLRSNYFIGLSEKRKNSLGSFGVFAYLLDHIFMRFMTVLYFYHVLLSKIYHFISHNIHYV
jgi:hypothetical protein